MADLTIYLVPLHRSFNVGNIDLNTVTVDALIAKLTASGEISDPPPTDAGQPTIWKMTKSGKKSSSLGRCMPEPGFLDRGIVYLIAVPE